MTAPRVVTLVQAPRAPESLAKQKVWLTWRLESNPAKPEKLRKIPYYAGTNTRRSGTQGSSEDRNRLVDLKTALAAASRSNHAGVGLAILPGSSFGAIDFDDVVSEDGTIHPDVQPMLDCGYAELSPSQKGIRAFFQLPADEPIRSLKSFASDQADRPYTVEFFTDSGFVTFTGNLLPGWDLAGLEDTVPDLKSTPYWDLYCLRGGSSAEVPHGTPDPFAGLEPTLGLTTEQLQLVLSKIDSDCPEPDWLRIGWAIHHETEGSDEGYQLWHSWSRGEFGKGGKKYDQDACDARWERAGGNDGRTASVTARSILKAAGMSMKDFSRPKPESSSEIADTWQTLPEYEARRPPSWLIKGVLPQLPLVMIYGPSGSGKSFVALDLAMAVARGIPWRERRSRKARVGYLCAEGAGGFRNRLVAYREDQDIDPVTWGELPIKVMAGAPNLMAIEDVGGLMKSIEDAGGFDVIIIDTLAQVSPGANENAGEDMGKVLAHCRDLHEATGACIVLIHHAGKDVMRGARGWSGIKAACDAEIEIIRDGDNRSVRVSKMKDGEDGMELGFKLQSVKVGVDEDGDEITSCVIREAAVASRVKPKGEVQEALYETLVDMTSLVGGGVKLEEVVGEAMGRLGKGEDKVAARNARKAMRGLIDRGLIIADGELLVAAENGTEQ